MHRLILSRWPSGKAQGCNPWHPGSNPGLLSSFTGMLAHPGTNIPRLLRRRFEKLSNSWLLSSEEERQASNLRVGGSIPSGASILHTKSTGRGQRSDKASEQGSIPWVCTNIAGYTPATFYGRLVLTGTHWFCTPEFGVRFPGCPPFHARLAQLGECLFYTQEVGGSKPSLRTIFSNFVPLSFNWQEAGLLTR